MNEYLKYVASCTIVVILISISNAISRAANALENISANSNIVFALTQQNIQKVAK